ncbi:MAG: SDR family oxidoreductase [Rhodospirillales bacterium]
MKLAIFGGTGATGRQLVDQALQAGHDVTVFVRTANAIPIENPRLRTMVGNFEQAVAIQSVVRDQDAVISVLGVRKHGSSTICTDGVQSILQAMEATGARRLIALSAYGASETRDASLFIKFVRTVIADKMRDKDNMEALVRASGIEWTLVRPPALTNGKRTGRYRSGIDLKVGITGRISRADLADFILQEIMQKAFTREAPIISA